MNEELTNSTSNVKLLLFKYIFKKMQSQARDLNIFTNPVLNKGLIAKRHKNLGDRGKQQQINEKWENEQKTKYKMAGWNHNISIITFIQMFCIISH